MKSNLLNPFEMIWIIELLVSDINSKAGVPIFPKDYELHIYATEVTAFLESFSIPLSINNIL